MHLHRLFAFPLGLAAAAALASSAPAASARAKPNILFIAVDDYRDWAGYIDRTHQAKTPNIDRLSRLRVSFTRALLANPATDWPTPAVITYRFKNHAARTADWRYIRYENGDEELYDERSDPNEYTNLATKPEFAAKKTELAKFFPKTAAPTPPSDRRPGDKKSGGKNHP